jgi:hypothetical protein
MEEKSYNYEKPLVIDLSAILPIYGGSCYYPSGAYSADPDTDE